MLDLPLERIHRAAFAAAQAVRCAQDQGRFWEMHDRLFENSRNLEPLGPHAEAIGLDMGAFDACMESEESAAEIRKDMALAKKIGATGTPGFVIGLTDPTDPRKVKGVSFINGAMHYSAFKLQIDRALRVEN